MRAVRRIWVNGLSIRKNKKIKRSIIRLEKVMNFDIIKNVGGKHHESKDI